MNLLNWFVSARFWLAPAFCVTYYAQLVLPIRLYCFKRFCLALLITTLIAAILANVRWIPDYRDRLAGGIAFLRAQQDTMREEREILSQIRWTNAKILAIIAMILGVLLHYEKLELLSSSHRVPVLVVALLVLVALFDAALDLEAEWTISVLAATRSVDSRGVSKMLLSHAIWNTNQFRKAQKELYEKLQKREEPRITFRSFTATAQNLISFAIIVVSGTAALAIRFLCLQW